MEEILLTPEQVAARLQVADQTVYNLLRGGRLSGVRIGRLWRIRPAALQAYLTENTTSTAWREKMEALLVEVRSQVPPGIPQERIEADAAAAVAEAREYFRARGR